MLRLTPSSPAISAALAPCPASMAAARCRRGVSFFLGAPRLRPGQSGKGHRSQQLGFSNKAVAWGQPQGTGCSQCREMTRFGTGGAGGGGAVPAMRVGTR